MSTPAIALGRIAPDRFNALRLPVVAMPNGTGQPALVPHPTLGAVNAFCRRQGRPEISPALIVNAGMRFLESPPAPDAHRALIARDLATRLQPLAHFDLTTIPAGPYRDTGRLLVELAGLGDLYRFLQLDPGYVDRFGAIVATDDPVRIGHFWLTGAEEFLEPQLFPEGTVFPRATEPRPPHGILWPPHFTPDDVEALRKSPALSPALRARVLSPEARLVETCESDPKAFKHNGRWYRPVSMRSDPNLAVVSDMMAERLEQAALLIADADGDVGRHYAAMLRGRARYLQSAALFAGLEDDRLWVAASHPYFSLSCTRGEPGDRFGVRDMMQVHVGYNDPDHQRSAQTTIAHFPNVHAQLIGLWSTPGTVPFDPACPHIPTVDVVSPIICAGAMNCAAYVPGGFNQPNNDRYEDPTTQMPKRLVIFESIARARIETEGLPLARGLFSEETVRRLEAQTKNSRAALRFINAHEVAHSLGPLRTAPPRRTQDGMGTYSDLYGIPLSGGLEEGKADLVGMLSLSVYLAEGAISVDERNAAYDVYLGNTLRNLLLDSEESHGIGSVLNWALLERWSVIGRGRGGLAFDHNRFAAVLPHMVKEYLDIYGSGNKAVADDFYLRARAQIAADTLVGRRIAEMKASGEIKKSRPYYLVTGAPLFG